MKIYWIKVLAVCAMFFSSCAYAQWEFQKFCVEAAPDAGAHCKLQPDTFTPWVYGTGYGGTHPTAAASAEATVNFLGYLSNPSVCDFSYWLGEEEVVQRDGFIHSQEPVRTTIKVYIRSGGKNQKGQCVDVKTGYIMMYPGRAAKCIAPADYAELRLNSAGASTGACFTRVTDVPVACDACPAKLLKGNPIQVASQEKVEIERDILINGAMPMEFRRTYRSYRARDKNHWFNNYFKVTDYAVLGEGWVHNYDIRLAVKRVSREDLGILDLVRIQAGDGSFHYFHRRGNSSVYTSRHPSHQLIELANEWIFDDGQNEVRYVFEKDGKLREQILRNGWRISYLYVPGTSQLDKVWNTFGQGFKFQYGGGKITRVQPINSPLDEGVEFQYADSLMIGVSQSAGARQYLYAEFTGGAPLLVGVVDEYGTRYATYTYDSQARALSTERAGGVFKYTVPSAGSAIDPLGTSRNYGFQRFGHELVYRGVSKVSEFPGDLPISGGAIQSDGLVRSYRDYLYTDTTISWDVQRRLPVFITRAAGTDLAQNTAILWSSQWRLPAEVTEPGRTTTYTYDSVGNRLSQTIADTTAG
ncbi:DUF6531 domain-containing protein, partial [Acidovorax sp.]|uniref:DUF6531 domain-containing protein n=1 Tax=Acidovorax sp. TaxID=1872122 RepID=UPI0025B9584D